MNKKINKNEKKDPLMFHKHTKTTSEIMILKTTRKPSLTPLVWSAPTPKKKPLATQRKKEWQNADNYAIVKQTQEQAFQHEMALSIFFLYLYIFFIFHLFSVYPIRTQQVGIQKNEFVILVDAIFFSIQCLHAAFEIGYKRRKKNYFLFLKELGDICYLIND